MKYTVLFIGKDIKYLNKLKSVFSKVHSDMELDFRHINDLGQRTAKSIFIEIYELMPQIVYVDYTTDQENAFSLCKFLNKNNETRLIATVGLFPYQDGYNLIKKAINIELRLCHFKTGEMHDVIYDPISLIDVNVAHSKEFTACKEFKNLEIFQPMRIGYIGNNYFHIETNTYLKLGSIIEVDTHPLIHIMPSRKVFVAKFDDKNLYYNKRFSYDLEFIYIDNDYFAATNKRWLLFKELKDNPEKLEELDKQSRRELFEDMETRKRFHGPVRKRIDDWLVENKAEANPKKLKIMIIDSSLQLIKDYPGDIEDFPYTLNVQSTPMHEFYQLKRTMPHLIVYCFDEKKNTEEKLHQLISEVKAMGNYVPFILGFNYRPADISERFDYEKIISYPKSLTIEEIRSLAVKIDDKLHISNADSKIFPSSHDSHISMLMKRNLTVKTMTESVIYFESPEKLALWTVFIVKRPVAMLLTIVPKAENDPFKSENDVYRALINGIGESEKASLRQFINNALAINLKS